MRIARVVTALASLAGSGGIAAADGGLHATGRIRSAEPGPSLSVALGTGYGWTEEVLDTGDTHHRIGGSAAIAVRAMPWLELGGELRGRYDKHTGDMPDDGFIGDPRLWAMIGGHAGGNRYLALRLGVWLPGADAPSVESDAISAEASALLTFARPGRAVTLTAGYRLDRSTASAPDHLSPNDRIGLGLSEADAVLFGIRGAHGAGRWTMVGELSMDLLLGDDAPGAAESPLRAGLGVRRALDQTVSFEAMLEIAGSKRPPPDEEALVAIEPRVAALVGLSWRPRPAVVARRPSARTVLLPPPEETPPPPPLPTTGTLSGRILDPDGAPLPGATVRLGGRSVTTGDDGTFTIDAVAPGDVELQVERPGHQPGKAKATVAAGADTAVFVNLARVKLPSQIRGVIRDFSGKGLPAKVRVEPLGIEATAAADGTLSMDIPPGTYTVVISHPGYDTQQKKNITVEDEGVASLNVELRKARR